MDKLFEKSIKQEKGKLKNLLDKLKVTTKHTAEYNKLYKQKNAIVDSLYNSGVKNIIWNKKTYSLLDDINRRKKAGTERKEKLKQLSHTPKAPTGVVKYDNYNKNLIRLSDNLKAAGSKDVSTDIVKVKDLINNEVEEVKKIVPDIETVISVMNDDFSNLGLNYKKLKGVYDKLDGDGEGATEEEAKIINIYKNMDKKKKANFKKKIKNVLNTIYRFFKPKKKVTTQDTQTTQDNIQDKGTVKSGEPGVQPEENPTVKFTPQKEYKMNDIVTITTQAHDIDAVYMGLVGEDVQDVISKINNKFEKADPFDGVFVMVRNTLPEVFASRGIDILLINENLVGQRQRVKGYLSNGKLKASFDVLLKGIKLKGARDQVTKIAASKVHNIEGDLLERINSKEFKELMKELEKVNIMSFESYNSMKETDFVLVNENSEDYWQELGEFEDWYTDPTDLNGLKGDIYDAYVDGDIDKCKRLIKDGLLELFPDYMIPDELVDYAYDNVDQIG